MKSRTRFGNTQFPIKSISHWQKVLRCFRLVFQEFSSCEGDEEFIAGGVDAIAGDLREQADQDGGQPVQWNDYRLTGTDGTVIVLKLKMYIEGEYEDEDV